MSQYLRCNHFPQPTRDGGLGQCVLEFGHAGEHQWEITGTPETSSPEQSSPCTSIHPPG